MALTNLLHDPSFPLGEGNVTTRLVLDEFDLDLSSLTASLLVIVIIVIACLRHSRTLCASRIEAVAGQVIAWGRVIKGIRIGDVGHVDKGFAFCESMDRIGRSAKSRLGCRDFDERGNSTVWVWFGFGVEDEDARWMRRQVFVTLCVHTCSEKQLFKNSQHPRLRF